MKRILTFPVILVVVAFFLICSCSGKPDRSRKPVSIIEIMPRSTNYVLGQQIQIHVKTKLKDGHLRKVDVFLNNNLLASDKETEFAVSISELSSVGINTIRVIAEKTDGNSNARSQSFTVLSDLVPLKYTYELVREFKHSATNFTQGLEIRNGYLYEGTGENGKSYIYKTDLTNNKTLLSKPLPEQYFGEGITVLNDNVYQLTYRHQTGFVYNVKDFAVIDSFRFESKEGWGLTNDGKSLIMSDGTGTLTWIDPEDFTVKKRIQVADHQKVYQYLNELEYDSGTLWANIWTTDQIIRIDANSGRILGYLDMKGILGVMETNTSERIDVLNGIALMPLTGNLLVTGKLWPKMFEIKVIRSK